jgi:hypothetical protein
MLARSSRQEKCFSSIKDRGREIPLNRLPAYTVVLLVLLSPRYLYAQADTVFSFQAPTGSPVGLATDGSSFWISDIQNSSLFRVSRSGELLKTLSLSLAVGFLYQAGSQLLGVAEQQGKIVEIDTSTGAITTLFGSPDSSARDPDPSGLAWDGDALWLSVYGNSPRMYRLDRASGALLGSFQSPTESVLGIAWSGGYLYGVDAGNRQIYKMNPFTGETIDSASWQVPHPLGLVSDGPFLWNVSGNIAYGGTARIYKVTNRILLGIGNGLTARPGSSVLYANYPNPFNPGTSIGYRLGEAAHVTLTVYDMLGRRVATPVNGPRKAGTHYAAWDGSRSSSGVYFYKLEAGGFVQTRKMILLR